MKIHRLVLATLSCVTAATAACGRGVAVATPAPRTWIVADTTTPFATSMVTLDAPLASIAIPSTDTIRFPTRFYTSRPGAIVVKLFDERSPIGAPGPLITPARMRKNLGLRVADVGPERLIAGLPGFGYLWRVNTAAVRVSLDDARRAAAEASVELVRDPSSGSLHAIQPGAWELWIGDDETLRLLRAEAATLGVTGVAVFVKR